MIADVAYQSRTPDFWQACDGLGGQATWENVGLNADGKGQPAADQRHEPRLPAGAVPPDQRAADGVSAWLPTEKEAGSSPSAR